MPCQVVLTSEHASEATRGAVLGALNAIGSFGMFLGPLIAGMLYKIKPQVPLLASMVSCVLSVVLALLHGRGRAPATTKSDVDMGNDMGEALMGERKMSTGSESSIDNRELIHVDFPQRPTVLIDQDFHGSHGPPLGA